MKLEMLRPNSIIDLNHVNAINAENAINAKQQVAYPFLILNNPHPSHRILKPLLRIQYRTAPLLLRALRHNLMPRSRKTKNRRILIDILPLALRNTINLMRNGNLIQILDIHIPPIPSISMTLRMREFLEMVDGFEIQEIHLDGFGEVVGTVVRAVA